MTASDKNSTEIVLPAVLNCIPLRDTVIFPFTIYPLLIGRSSSIRSLQDAMEKSKLVFVAAQRDPGVDDITRDDLYPVGVVAKVLQFIRLPNDNFKILIEGFTRAKMTKFTSEDGYGRVRYALIERHASRRSRQAREAKRRILLQHFGTYTQLNRDIPEEALANIREIDDIERLCNVVAAHLSIKQPDKQALLETEGTDAFLDRLISLLVNECDILAMGRKIEDQVRSRIQKNQKQLYLHEQMKTIREELGEQDAGTRELVKLEKRIREAGMPETVEHKAMEELGKLRQLSPLSPESGVLRNYLDWLVAMPWQKRSDDNLDVDAAQEILDRNHYGLKDPKERIVEYLAVISLVKKIKGPVICLVGPPGVGKTSLGRSIAEAMGRSFVRISLGGVRDEAEIRGHRRTYIGSMPGKIIQMIRRAGTKNPVLLLDEVDKMSADFRGDPAAALLEVLDPEQNHTFNDHYLDVDFDLSEALFITTANVMYSIPYSLQDRMEIIELPGYLEHEKLQIARTYLLPRQRKDHGLTAKNLSLPNKTLSELIRCYTKESGVRNLEREIANICRKIARKIARKGARKKSYNLSPADLSALLGPARFEEKTVEERTSVGAATGLAWTELGGEILAIEVSLMRGKGALTLTGQMGEVMQESAKAALTYARAHAGKLGIDPGFNEKFDMHIHIPEGAIPKDGPSAGITMALAIISALSGRPVNRLTAMSGEITLRGNVLPVGGLNEKILAAKQAGIRTVILPKKNAKDIKGLPDELKKHMTIKQAGTLNDVLKAALL